LRRELLGVMQRTGDPFADAFANRDNKDRASAVLEGLKKEYGRRNGSSSNN